VGGLVGGVVVGGVVVGGVVVGGVVVGGAVVGGDVGDGDLVTGAVVGGEDVEVPPDGVFVAVGDVVLVLVLEPPPPVEVGVDTDVDADDFPLERTANQSFSTPWPVATPFLESLTKRYSAWSWKKTWNRPPCTRMAFSPLTPCGALMCVTPFGNSSGGHTFAQAAVHVALPAGSTV
jgi:hypothetical protein